MSYSQKEGFEEKRSAQNVKHVELLSNCFFLAENWVGVVHPSVRQSTPLARPQLYLEKQLRKTRKNTITDHIPTHGTMRKRHRTLAAT